MKCLRRNSGVDYDPVTGRERDYYEGSPKRMACWKKTLLIIAITIFVIALLLFLALFVAVPIAFMESLPMERFFTFFNVDEPKDPQFDNPKKYNMDGVQNFYITTFDYDSNFKKLSSIGAWLIQPKTDILSNKTNPQRIVHETNYPILLYFHGVACNRILPQLAYKVLRKYFLIIAVDYRAFGDSTTDPPLSETGVLHDNVQVFHWVRQQNPTQKIYVWGHSLGTALSTRMVRALKEESGIVPMGLILESPFTTLREEIVNNALGKIFTWLPYFEQTFLNPLDEHGFKFETTKNILEVDSPIMIMHAEDDNVIPYTLGRKLAQIAATQRDMSKQGNVTYHQFPALGYRHVGILNDPKSNRYIEEFMAICEFYNKGRG